MTNIKKKYLKNILCKHNIIRLYEKKNQLMYTRCHTISLFQQICRKFKTYYLFNPESRSLV